MDLYLHIDLLLKLEDLGLAREWWDLGLDLYHEHQLFLLALETQRTSIICTWNCNSIRKGYVGLWNLPSQGMQRALVLGL
jgi:hypothetical protein|uniref:Uncharacterized protein n=1 Tax=Picea glauca TaxID=3330 RepID=A0A117NFV4_PICGL|nr:hypothetical protein ABT39_MTgene2321 [Picea glauca]